MVLINMVFINILLQTLWYSQIWKKFVTNSSITFDETQNKSKDKNLERRT